MRRVTTIADLRAALRQERAAGRRVALAPTMGALHEGHLANVRLAADQADAVVVSIFVNPTQFDRPDDLAAYPRTLDDDEAAIDRLGLGVALYVFAPTEREMYPRPPRTAVRVAGVTDTLEGAARPGHFDGVATVVTKLLNIVGPDLAVFGRKDFQQNVVIRHLVDDLDVPVELLFGPTIREPDGLARSSRNRRLSRDARAAAAVLPRALRAAVEAAREDRARSTVPDPAGVRKAAAATLAAVPAVAVDYLAVVDPDTLAPLDPAGGEDAGQGANPTSGVGTAHRLLVAVAATVGGVRLIDNVEIGNLGDEDRLLAATAEA